MMRNLFLIGCFLLFFATVSAQKVINNPDCVSQNIGSITKVELTDQETIIHFYVKHYVGGWMSIPKTTYIEDSFGKGERLYITKAKGLDVGKRISFENSDEIRYTLYFPPLSKDIKKINYGERNLGGNWYIYKLDLRKDGKKFISKNKESITNALKFSMNNDIINKIKEATIDLDKNIRSNIQNNLNSNINTILPKDLPKGFFGCWYDKYGTLLLITTPDYIVSDNRIKYYNNIEKIGDSKFKIQTSSTSFEILNLEDKTMTIRTNRLITLEKKSNLKRVPQFLKGKWLHWEKVKEITITDDYFYNEDKDYHGTYRDPVKNKIDYIAESNNGELIWFVLYNQGNYNIYFVKKVNDEYILQPRGFVGARYTKTED